MGKRWFHKEDGGLIQLDNFPQPRCSICGATWDFGFFGHLSMALTEAGDDTAWTHFSDLPEDLQAAALSEML